MSFKINEFASELGKKGFARPAYFAMEVGLPTALKGMFEADVRALRLRVESASLPTRIVLTHDQRYYGPQRRIPYGYAAQDLAFTVILSEDYREREIFLAWQDLALGASRLAKKGSPQQGIFDAGYYKTATDGGSIELSTYATSPSMQGGSTGPTIFGELRNLAAAVGFDPSQISRPLGFELPGTGQDRKINAAMKTTLIEPYPINVNEVPLNWADDGYARLNIIMQHRYVIEEPPIAVDGGDSGGVAGLLRSGLNAFNRFKPIISMIRRDGIGGTFNTFTGQLNTNAMNNIRSIGAGI